MPQHSSADEEFLTVNGVGKLRFVLWAINPVLGFYIKIINLYTQHHNTELYRPFWGFQIMIKTEDIRDIFISTYIKREGRQVSSIMRGSITFPFFTGSVIIQLLPWNYDKLKCLSIPSTVCNYSSSGVVTALKASFCRSHCIFQAAHRTAAITKGFCYCRHQGKNKIIWLGCKVHNITHLLQFPEIYWISSIREHLHSEWGWVEGAQLSGTRDRAGNTQEKQKYHLALNLPQVLAVPDTDPGTGFSHNRLSIFVHTF